MFRHLSIQHKLTILLVGTVAIVLLVASVATLVTDLRAIRERRRDHYSSLATVVAVSGAAALYIADFDPSAAEEVVSEFSVEPTVLFAALYNSKGKRVAHYQSRQQGEVLPVPPDEVGSFYTRDGFLDVVQQVTLKDGSVIGRLYLRANLDVLKAETERKLIIMAAVFVGALLLALLLSIALQRLISNPILELAGLAARVSNEHDYSLRAVKVSEDEIGVLCNGFNAMLAEIQSRDAELRIHHLSLEETVARRTAQLQGRTEELSRSNAELEQFAYIASHDLQEPLRKVQAFGDMLTTEFREVLGAEGQDYLQRMQNAAKRMQVLINDLLNFSRVMTKAKPFVLVNLKLVAEQVMVDLETRLQKTGGRVEIGDLPTLAADPIQMQQLFQNLIGNGLKYHRLEVAPVVSVQSRMVSQNDGPPGTLPSPLFCEISVSDNGMGFEQKYAERIFAPFERLHGREVEGTGMGLAICRKIVERHGGTITAQGILDRGAVFVARLPMTQTEGRAT